MHRRRAASFEELAVGAPIRIASYGPRGGYRPTASSKTLSEGKSDVIVVHPVFFILGKRSFVSREAVEG